MPAVTPLPMTGDDVALSTTRAVIISTPYHTGSNPHKYLIQNNSAIAVTVGGADVADGSNGIVIQGGTNHERTLVLELFHQVDVYAIAASGTPSVQVLRLH